MAADIASYLDQELRTSSFEDSSVNGLQVESSAVVKRVGFAVDACLASISAAAEARCQLLIVHHGLFWKPGMASLRGVAYRRTRALMRSDIALYASHLPLDAHPRYGNNAALARLLGLRDLKPFGRHGNASIGVQGMVRPATLRDIAKRLDAALSTRSRIFPAAIPGVKRIGVISGSGASFVEEAAEEGLDLLVTGEFKHGAFHAAKEAGVSVIAAGHYATETLGVKALMPVLTRKFGVKTVFLDAPTGL